MAFRCVICGSFHYQQAVVRRPDGNPYRTDFFHCLGCGVVFVEPELMTLADEYRQTLPEQLPEMHHECAAIHQEAFNRYWRARARREYGCSEPTRDQINALRMALESTALRPRGK